MPKSALLGLWLFAAMAGPSGAEMRFRHHFADTSIEGRNWGQLEAADLVGDGTPDIIISQSHWDNPDASLYWYRNTGRPDRWGPRVRIADRVISDCGIFAADVDRDRRVDIVSSSVWYRNAGVFDGKRLFERYVYDRDLAATPRSGAHDVIAAVLDPQHGLSVMTQHGGTGAEEYKGLHLYRMPERPTGEWPRVDLAAVTNQHGGILPRGIGDLNGDGRADIVYIDRWFEDTKEAWKEHRNIDFGRAGKFGVCARTWVADMDGDGRMDVVEAECDIPQPQGAWFRNVRGDGLVWEKHVLPETGPVGGYHSLVVADFDCDGDLDVYVDEMEHIDMPASRPNDPSMYIWENLDVKRTRWRKHTVFAGAGGHQAQVADFNGDGAPDIVTKTYAAGPGQPYVRLSVLEDLSKRRAR